VKAKTIATFALIAFVIASVVFLVAKVSRRSPLVAAPSTGSAVATAPAGRGTGDASPGQPIGQGPTVIAYYFHGNFRCASCVKIEALSRKAITEGFPEEIRSGRLQFREVNVDEAQYQHFIGEYQLASQSLILVEVRDGRQIRWRNLEKVWTLLDSEKEFIPYVRDGVSGFLKSA
jgi:hypothetical protein